MHHCLLLELHALTLVACSYALLLSPMHPQILATLPRSSSMVRFVQKLATCTCQLTYKLNRKKIDRELVHQFYFLIQKRQINPTCQNRTVSRCQSLG